MHIQNKKKVHSINHLNFHQNPSGQASNCCCFGRSLPTVSSGLKVDFGISTWHGNPWKRENYPATNPAGWGDFYLSSAIRFCPTHAGALAYPKRMRRLVISICIPGTCLFFVLGLNPPQEFIQMNSHFQWKKTLKKIQCKKGNGVFRKYHALYPAVGQTWEWLLKEEEKKKKKKQSYSSRIGPRKSPFINHAVDSTPFEADELTSAKSRSLRTLIFWDVALNHWS